MHGALTGVGITALGLDFSHENYLLQLDLLDWGAGEVVASTYPGVPPTPAQGVTGEVAYVGAGTAADIAAADVWPPVRRRCAQLRQPTSM